MSMITAFHDWIDSRAVVRRIVLFFTLYMTWKVTHLAWLFAQSSPFDGLGTAAVIAAITSPVAVLQGFAFKEYSRTRSRAE